MKAVATAKFVGTSARKTGLVAGLIRGRRAAEAQNILLHTDKRATGPIGLVLGSAIANATTNHGMKAEDLVIESILIGPGPTAKRMRPRARGSASRIRKRSSHITVVLTDGRAEVAAPAPAPVEEAKPEPEADTAPKEKPEAKKAPEKKPAAPRAKREAAKEEKK